MSGSILAGATAGVLAAGIVLAAGPQAAAEPVVSPKVATDRSIDCSSLETIVRDLVKPGMSDREKALAIYHWYRRVVFHFRYMGSDRRNVLRVINSYGCQLCGSQAAVVRQVYNAAGLKARIASANVGKEMGHTFLEVFYDGKWHCLDTMTSFYVLDRGDPPSIASLAEMKADPTLVTRAVEEGRSGPEFLYCLKQREVDFAKRKAMERLGMKKDIAWTLLVLAGGNDLMTFWTGASSHSSVKDPDNPYGGRYEPGLLDITLKPHEEYVRLWDNVGKWVHAGTFDVVGPYHTCGPVDELDPINFKYYEPYRKANVGFAGYAYRYYANGWLDWRPRGGEILLGARPTNLRLDRKTGFLRPAAANRSASLLLPVKSPYAVVEVALELEVAEAAKDAELAVTCLAGRKPLVRRMLRPAAGPVTLLFDLGSRRTPNRGLFEYRLRIDAKGAVAFALRRLKTTFMLNMYSLPYLVPGRNVVTVSAAGPKRLEGARLLVNYQWDEGEGWNVRRSHTARVTSFPRSYTIEAAGPKMPRMRRLVMKVVPAGE